MTTFDDKIPAWVGAMVARSLKRRDDLITELRAERVKLQGENESLRHDIATLERELSDRTGDEFVRKYEALYIEEPSAQLDEMAKTPRPVKTEADIAALAERLARVEDAQARMTLTGETRHKDVHSRIDSVTDIIGQRLGAIIDRVADLERLAADRGTRLDDLERRQDQDDLDRAAGEGMPEAPERPTHSNGLQAGGETRESFYEPQGAVERDTFIVPEGMEAVRDAEGRATGELKPATTVMPPTRLRVAVNLGLGKDYGVGDWVRVSPCRSAGGHRDVMAGWYPVVGITAAQHNGPSAQVQLDLSQTPIPQLVWIADRCVIDASPTRPTAE